MGGVTDFIFPGSQYLNFGGGGGGGDDDNGAGYQPTPQRQLQHQAYQPNFESFWDPMAMSQAGQPSFDNPFWYQATEPPLQTQQAPVAQPQPQAIDHDAVAQMRDRIGLMRHRLNLDSGAPVSLFGPRR